MIAQWIYHDELSCFDVLVISYAEELVDVTQLSRDSITSYQYLGRYWCRIDR